MSPTTVRVTGKHIAEGRACSGSECPIALAVLEALAAQGVKAGVMVDSYDVTVTQNDAAGYRRFRAGLDSHASSFVDAFDEPEDSDLRDADIIAPFELELTWRELVS
ncbi:MAG TPA: hypothetical protein VH372_17065 [Actinospica sp.]|nr:hypothetical protein [Actinospica sp.]